MRHVLATHSDPYSAGAYVRSPRAAFVDLPFTCSWAELLTLDSNRSEQRSTLHVSVARSQAQHARANGLIRKMYSSRGYETEFLSKARIAEQQTFVAGTTPADCLGTITVMQDSPEGLQVDALFPEEVDAVRAQGRRICEFSRLAVDDLEESKKVLASLFHVAFSYSQKVQDCDDIFIEVNPRHAPFYIRMLGFERAAEAKICPRVNAPAVLLRMEVRRGAKKVEKFCGSVLSARSVLQ